MPGTGCLRRELLPGGGERNRSRRIRQPGDHPWVPVGLPDFLADRSEARDVLPQDVRQIASERKVVLVEDALLCVQEARVVLRVRPSTEELTPGVSLAPTIRDASHKRPREDVVTVPPDIGLIRSDCLVNRPNLSLLGVGHLLVILEHDHLSLIRLTLLTPFGQRSRSPRRTTRPSYLVVEFHSKPKPNHSG